MFGKRGKCCLGLRREVSKWRIVVRKGEQRTDRVRRVNQLRKMDKMRIAKFE